MIELLVHDLRNPLTILLSVLELIGMVDGPTLSTQQQDLIANARRSGNYMVGLISDLLDVARLEAGQLQLKREPLELPRLLQEAVEQARVPARQGDLALEIATNGRVPSVSADGQLIQRVLTNLVANAVAHTPPGGRVVLRAAASPPGFVTVTVADTGQGIPLDQQQRIFEKFVQGEQRGGRRRGTGLGLAFCKLAVEAHAGRIWVESAPEQGSTFAFTLPAEQDMGA
jgi:signal transduction histidine kinase